MGDKKDANASARGAAEYRKDIVDIVDKIGDERFLRRIYISLREYVTEKGLE